MPNAIIDLAHGFLFASGRGWLLWTDPDTLTTRAIPLPDSWDDPVLWAGQGERRARTA